VAFLAAGFLAARFVAAGFVAVGFVAAAVAAAGFVAAGSGCLPVSGDTAASSSWVNSRCEARSYSTNSKELSTSCAGLGAPSRAGGVGMLGSELLAP
jgi:hypothetical protein